MRRRGASLDGGPSSLGTLAAIACAAITSASTACASTDGMPAAPVAGAAPIARTAPPASAASAAPIANPWLDPAREVLVPHCGSCHRGDLPTALPNALAIFDLTHPI